MLSRALLQILICNILPPSFSLYVPLSHTLTLPPPIHTRTPHAHLHSPPFSTPHSTPHPGTITANSADIWSYATDEDTLVIDPLLPQHLSHWGIDIMRLEKTDKSMTEMEVELNMKVTTESIVVCVLLLIFVDCFVFFILFVSVMPSSATVLYITSTHPLLPSSLYWPSISFPSLLHLSFFFCLMLNKSLKSLLFSTLTITLTLLSLSHS